MHADELIEHLSYHCVQVCPSAVRRFQNTLKLGGVTQGGLTHDAIRVEYQRRLLRSPQTSLVKRAAGRADHAVQHQLRARRYVYQEYEVFLVRQPFLRPQSSDLILELSQCPGAR